MEEDIIKKLEIQDAKIEAIFQSVEKTRKYFLASLIITVSTIVVPLIAAIVLIPWMLRTITSAYTSLGI